MENAEMNDTVSRVIKLIRDARQRACTGQYGEQDVEYPDVKERFDEALVLLQSLLLKTDTN